MTTTNAETFEELIGRVTLGNYVAARPIGDDGLFVYVTRMIYNWRLVYGSEYSADKSWCYRDLVPAMNAFDAFDPDVEPSGWIKEVHTGRSRELAP